MLHRNAKGDEVFVQHTTNGTVEMHRDGDEVTVFPNAHEAKAHLDANGFAPVPDSEEDESEEEDEDSEA